MVKEKWFNPDERKHTGWSKNLKASIRRHRLLASTDKRKTMHDRYVEAGRRILALSNVTRDKETSRKAKADAEYFFRKAKR